MKDYNHTITDQEIHELFKQRLLEQDVDDTLTQKLIDMETQAAFTGDILLAVNFEKEKQMLQRLGKKTGLNLWSKWLFTGLGCAVVALSVFLYAANNDHQKKQENAPVHTESVTALPFNEPAQAIVPVNNAAAAQALSPNNHRPPAQQFVANSDSLPAKEDLQPMEKSQENIAALPMTPMVNRPMFFNKDSSNGKQVSVDTVFKGVKRLEVNGSFCDITVSTHAEDNISLKGELGFESKGLVLRKPDYKMRFEQKDSVLKIWITNTKKPPMLIVGSQTFEGHLNFEVPRQLAVVLRNSGGKISVNGIEGKPCNIESNYGPIVAENIHTDMLVRSNSGDITLKKISGKITCFSSYGNNRFSNITGSVHLISSSGNTELSDLKGEASISCSYGNVDLSRITGSLSIMSASGYIKGDDIEGQKILASSSYGDIIFSNIAAPLIISSKSGKVKLNNITGKIVMSSSYGDQQLKDIKGDLVSSSASGSIDLDHLQGAINIHAVYGDVSASDCNSGMVTVTSESGNIRAKNMALAKSMFLTANYGDIRVNLKNKIDELSFNLETAYGNLQINKDGTKIEGEKGKLIMDKGDITIRAISKSGNQSFD